VRLIETGFQRHRKRYFSLRTYYNIFQTASEKSDCCNITLGMYLYNTNDMSYFHGRRNIKLVQSCSSEIFIYMSILRRQNFIIEWWTQTKTKQTAPGLGHKKNNITCISSFIIYSYLYYGWVNNIIRYHNYMVIYSITVDSCAQKQIFTRSQKRASRFFFSTPLGKHLSIIFHRRFRTTYMYNI